MKPHRSGRVLAALCLGTVLGVFRYFVQTHWIAKGRDAYLADQAHRFDRMAHYNSIPASIIAYLIIAAVLIGLYELVAAGITNVLPTTSVEE